jgi:hypothetical protein
MAKVKVAETFRRGSPVKVFERTDDGGLGREVAEVTADAEGGATLPKLPAGEYWLRGDALYPPPSSAAADGAENPISRRVVV